MALNKNDIISLLEGKATAFTEKVRDSLDEKRDATIEANLDMIAATLFESNDSEEVDEDVDGPFLTEEEINDLLENYEQLDELSKKTLKRYVNKALNNKEVADELYMGSKPGSDREKKFAKRSEKRKIGILRAVNRLAKEEFDPIIEEFEQLDELSKHKLTQYIGKAGDDEYRRKFGANIDLKVHSNLKKMADDETNPATKKKIQQTSNNFFNSAARLTKKANKRNDGIALAARKVLRAPRNESFDPIIEEFEQLDELSKKTLANYIKKGKDDIANVSAEYGKAQMLPGPSERLRKHEKRYFKRRDGLNRAADKLAKEEFDPIVEAFEQLDELSKKTLASYIKKGKDDLTVQDHTFSGNMSRQAELNSKAGEYGTGNQTRKALKAKANIAGRKAAIADRKFANRSVGIERAADKLAKD